MVSSRVCHEAMNRLETISNLAFILREDAPDPQLQQHAAMIEEQALELGRFLRSVTTELKACTAA